MRRTAAEVAQLKRQKLTLERTFESSVEEVWELWTTRSGIESWWGPDGFEVKVRRLELRPGGVLDYTMTAVLPDQIEFLSKAGMALSTQHRVMFREVDPRRRLVYEMLADFIPGVEPYPVTTAIDFESTANGVRVVVTFDAMHDERWTQLATMGREGELARLAALLKK